MSRIGRALITVPAGVTVDVAAGNLVTVKGPKGTLVQKMHQNMIITVEGATIKVERPNDEKQNKALHGLTRTLVNNMVVGVSQGYSKTLEIVGVGYKAAKAGKTLNLSLGFSHGISFEEGDGITFDVPNPTTVVVNGVDKQKVGQIAAQIREKRPPEPYHGQGVKYSTEVIRRKASKKSGK